MNRFHFIFIGVLFTQSITAQWTIILQNIPTSTPNNAAIYIASSFNNWNAADEAFKLSLISPNKYQITLNVTSGNYEFKFTRGDWSSVEGTSSGLYIPNRKFTFKGGVDTTYLDINGWEDLNKLNNQHSTAGPNVKVINTAFYIPQFDRKRRIWIYLPPDYNQTIDRIPVLYMLDGQNLFDQTTSFAGEWGVDETLDQLFKEQHFRLIVVGIDNGGTDRLNEYTPWSNPSYGGGQGDLTMRFIKETLKPYVDSNYRTIANASATGIMGSSLGGLMSHYGILHYQTTFQRAGIFSPSYWFSNEAFLQCRKDPIVEALKIYMIGGQNEGSNMARNILQMKDSLLINGLPMDRLNVVIHNDGMHNEAYWKREFGRAVTWLFSDSVSGTNDSINIPLQVFPNLVHDQLKINCLTCEGQINIYNTLGQLLQSQSFKQSLNIDVVHWRVGKYFIKFISKDGHYSHYTFLKM